MNKPLEPSTTTPAPTFADKVDHERLKSLINSMADGVIATDKKTNIVLYNGAALNILDRNDSMQNKMIASVMKLTDRNNQPVNVHRLVQGAKTPMSSRDFRLLLKDSSTINLYLNIAPVHLGYGQDGEQGYVLLLRDITHEKSLEEERDEFISVISHELRTPIAIAEGNIGNAEFVAKKTGNLTQIQQALKQAHEQILFLGGLINDLSTLSRAERGKLTLEVEKINVHEFIKELEQNYQPQAKEKHLEFRVELDPHLELLKSSRLYVREVLQNFITNAIKYTEKGHVTLGARATATGVLFYISDSGIGIGKPDQVKIFDKFFRSEDYRTRATSGTGLGLYVSMKLARLLHADIELQSEINKGSTFSISVPHLE